MGNKKKRKRPAPDLYAKYKKQAGGAAVKKKQSFKEKEEAEKRRQKRIRLFLIIFASVTALAILAGAVVGIVVLVRRQPVDYFNDNLGRYVYISEEDYRGFVIENTVAEVTERNVEQKILELLAKNRGKAQNNGEYQPTLTLTPGDEIEMRYIGYTKDVDGVKTYFGGGCNFYGEISMEDLFELGSGELILGFELGLLGKNTADFASLNIYEGGTTAAGDIVYVTATAMYPDGRTERKAAYIDLSLSTNDEKFGEGFDDFLVGKAVGVKLTEEKNGKSEVSSYAAKTEDGTIVYTDILINSTYRVSGSNVLTVEADFPSDYAEESLRGKTVFFDVFVMGGIDYEAPEYNEAFVADVLKLTEEDLAAFEGDTLVQKHRAKLFSEAVEDYEEELRAVVENALWDYLMEKATFKRIPKVEVDSYYETYYSDIKTVYKEQGQYYGYSSLDDFAIAYLGLEEGEDWQSFLREEAEAAVKTKLVFHYICNKEEIALSEDETESRADALRTEYLDEYLTKVGCTPDKYKTEEEYLSKVAEYKREMEGYYGEDYFEYEVFYVYALDKILELVTVV